MSLGKSILEAKLENRRGISENLGGREVKRRIVKLKAYILENTGKDASIYNIIKLGNRLYDCRRRNIDSQKYIRPRREAESSID